MTSRLSGNKACILKTFLPSQRTIPFLARESVFQCGSSSFVLSIIFLLAASGFHLFLSLVPHLLCTSSSSYSWTISAMLCSSRNSQLEGCGLLVCHEQFSAVRSNLSQWVKLTYLCFWCDDWELPADRTLSRMWNRILG